MEDHQRFKCKTCLKTYKLKISLTRHERIHSDSEAFTCTVCKKKCTSKSDLKCHMERHTQEKFPCSKCAKSFNTTTMLARHIKYIHENPDAFACDRCDYKFTSQSSLTRHYRTHTKEPINKPFQCNICEKRFVYNCNLEAHMQFHNKQRPFSCSRCNKAYSTKGKLKEHNKYDHAETPIEFRCPQCNKTFSRPCSLKKHLVKHSNDSFPWKCNLCDRKYSQKVALTAHKLEHSGKRPFSCSVSQCGKTFSSEIKMKRHVRFCHNAVKHGCWVYQKEFSRKYILTAHLKLYPGNHFSCDTCNRFYADKVRFDKHKEMHKTSVKKGCTCNICFRSLCNRMSLDHHLISMHHRSEQGRVDISQNVPAKSKIYACTKCKMSFSNKRRWKHHQNIHIALKLIRCFSCDRTFSRRESLFIHQRKSLKCRNVIPKAKRRKRKESSKGKQVIERDLSTGQMTGSDDISNIKKEPKEEVLVNDMVGSYMMGNIPQDYVPGSDIIKMEPDDVTGGHMAGNVSQDHVTGSDITPKIKEEPEDYGYMSGNVIHNHMSGDDTDLLTKQEPDNDVPDHLIGSIPQNMIAGSDVTPFFKQEQNDKYFLSEEPLLEHQSNNVKPELSNATLEKDWMKQELLEFGN